MFLLLRGLPCRDGAILPHGSELTEGKKIAKTEEGTQ